ncbi:hypothetical protein MJO28_006664 [Puccinia striiformis f. sp. tritici]|uniref:Uncharacterized protein n=1 Tax=Puccinia striiformis f. sp. tritici TaxID=168172 RepID=A0ACC0EJB8_9BASI|nr:hypothetical protein MJO28_006664 [Puccinia striiformis f. sp. tritici]
MTPQTKASRKSVFSDHPNNRLIRSISFVPILIKLNSYNLQPLFQQLNLSHPFQQSLSLCPRRLFARGFLGFNNLAKIPSNLKAKFSTYVFSLADGLKEKMIQRYDRDLSAEFQADAQKLTLLFNKRVIWTSNETIDKVLLSNRGMSFDEAIGV